MLAKSLLLLVHHQLVGNLLLNCLTLEKAKQ